MAIDLQRPESSTHHTDLTWNPTSSLRAPRISGDKWTEHKDRLCQMFQEKTLEEVMAVMKNEYGFTPRMPCSETLSTVLAYTRCAKPTTVCHPVPELAASKK